MNESGVTSKDAIYREILLVDGRHRHVIGDCRTLLYNKLFLLFSRPLPCCIWLVQLFIKSSLQIRRQHIYFNSLIQRTIQRIGPNTEGQPQSLSPVSFNSRTHDDRECQQLKAVACCGLRTLFTIFETQLTNLKTALKETVLNKRYSYLYVPQPS